ncbi:hypothetical protein LCM4579_19225 [Ensifer sp. LCM 4579]|nr:hypothetical protein LCM4579_19225 [Ensifer sp. LCM 4579]
MGVAPIAIAAFTYYQVAIRIPASEALGACARAKARNALPSDSACLLESILIRGDMQQFKVLQRPLRDQ